MKGEWKDYDGGALYTLRGSYGQKAMVGRVFRRVDGTYMGYIGLPLSGPVYWLPIPKQRSQLHSAKADVEGLIEAKEKNALFRIGIEIPLDMVRLSLEERRDLMKEIHDELPFVYVVIEEGEGLVVTVRALTLEQTNYGPIYSFIAGTLSEFLQDTYAERTL